MSPKSLLLCFSFLAAIAPSAAMAQSASRGTVSGVITSKSVTVPAMMTAPLFTAPAEGFFILTQTSTNGSGCITMSGSTVGRIPEQSTFTPGFALPANEVVSCTETCGVPFPVYCTLTGVLSKK